VSSWASGTVASENGSVPSSSAVWYLSLSSSSTVRGLVGFDPPAVVVLESVVTVAVTVVAGVWVSDVVSNQTV
jgi:hypothetical protein